MPGAIVGVTKITSLTPTAARSISEAPLRILAWPVAAVVLALSLISCGSNSTPKAASPATGAPAKDTRATVTIWSYSAENSGKWIDNELARFKTEYPNVKVNWTYVPGDTMVAKLLGTGVAGGAPDGIFYNPSDAAQLFQAGVVGDMTPYWNTFADRSQFPDSVVWRVGSKVLSVQGYTNSTALWYNKTILDKLGLQPPTTVAELDTDLKAIHKAGYGGLTMCATPTAESEFQIFPWLLGEGMNYGSWDQTKLTTVFGQLNSWIKAGYIPRDITSWNQADAFNKFSSGRYAFTQNGNWQLSAAKTALKFQWGVVPLPAGSAGSHSVGGGEGFSIGAKTTHGALVWQFFKEALLTKDSELGFLKDFGVIPVRADAAADPELSADPNLATFAQVVKGAVSRPSSPKISGYLIDVGKIWNALAGGQITPQQAAQEVVQQTSAL
jgi:ABC-type glycerol-3-phosphate transport system substrate-binding protein